MTKTYNYKGYHYFYSTQYRKWVVDLEEQGTYYESSADDCKETIDYYLEKYPYLIKDSINDSVWYTVNGEKFTTYEWKNALEYAKKISFEYPNGIEIMQGTDKDTPYNNYITVAKVKNGRVFYDSYKDDNIEYVMRKNRYDILYDVYQTIIKKGKTYKYEMDSFDTKIEVNKYINSLKKFELRYLSNNNNVESVIIFKAEDENQARDIMKKLLDNNDHLTGLYEI